jgi:hypothetical protein
VRVSQKLAPPKIKLPLRSALGRRCVESGSDIAVEAINNRLLIAIGDARQQTDRMQDKIIDRVGNPFCNHSQKQFIELAVEKVMSNERTNLSVQINGKKSYTCKD